MIFPDMDNQPRYKPQATNEYFSDHMNSRPKPAGTVIRGQGWEEKEVFSEDYLENYSHSTALYEGKNEDGSWATEFPIEVNYETMKLGREKYDIFCTVCHGAAGNGKGVTSKYGVIPANLLLDTYRTMPEGQIFETITDGKNTMFGYGEKVTPEERWAIILYVRALQRSQSATIEDIPADQRKELGL